MAEFSLKRNLTPRKWQRYAVEAWGFRMQGIAKIVTGGGKTIFSLFCLKQFFEKYPEGNCIIVVPTIVLMDQWYVELIENTNLSENQIALHGGGQKPDGGEKIHLMVINTARVSAHSIPNEIPRMLIVDECHRAASTENSKAIDISPEASLGLSATPERQYDDGFEDILVPKLGPIIYEYDYVQASKDGVISQFDLVNVKLEFNPEENADYNKLSRQIAIASSNKEEEEKLLQLLRRRSEVVANASIRIPWAVKLAQINQGSRTIIFHERISALEKIEQLALGLGLSAVTYHSKQSGPHRRRNLQMFRRGMVDLLITCRALDEGTNIPEAQIGIIASSTASTRQRIQRLGRVLRPAEGKTKATIYTLFVTEKEEQRLIEEVNQLNLVSDIKWKRGGSTND